MAPAEPVASDSPRYWVVLAARAVIAVIAGLIITFSLDHSPRLGLYVFGGFAVAVGLSTAVLTILVLADAPWRRVLVAQGAVTAVAGVVALVLAPGAGVELWLLILAIWAAASGVLELVAGLIARGRTPFAREWTTVGVLTMILAIVAALINPDLTVVYGGLEGVDGALTASVLTVGLFGAYAVLTGVYLAIAALSQKWGTDRPRKSHDTPIAEAHS